MTKSFEYRQKLDDIYNELVEAHYYNLPNTVNEIAEEFFSLVNEAPTKYSDGIFVDELTQIFNGEVNSKLCIGDDRNYGIFLSRELIKKHKILLNTKQIKQFRNFFDVYGDALSKAVLKTRNAPS